MEDFDKLIRNKSEYKEARAEKYKYDSKERLSKILDDNGKEVYV